MMETDSPAPYWTRLQATAWMMHRKMLPVDWIGEKGRECPGEPAGLLASISEVYEPVMDEWHAYFTLYKGCREGWITAYGRIDSGPWCPVPLEDWTDLEPVWQSIDPLDGPKLPNSAEAKAAVASEALENGTMRLVLRNREAGEVVWHSLRFSAVQIVRVWPPHDHDGSAAPAPDDDVAPPPPLEPAPAINKSLTNLKAQRVIAEFTRRREAGELPEDLGRHGTLMPFYGEIAKAVGGCDISTVSLALKGLIPKG